MRGYLRMARHRMGLVLVAGLAGAGLAWVAARPAERPPPTWSASVVLAMAPDRPAADVLRYHYQFLAARPDQSGAGSVPVTAHADPDAGRLTVTVAARSSSGAAEAAARAYAATIVAAGLDGARQERADELAGLRVREQQVATEALDLNEQLATARAHLSPAARARGGGVDPGLEAKLATDAAQLSALRARIDSLQARTDDELAPIRTAGAVPAAAEPAALDPVRISLGLATGATAALLFGLVLGALVSRYERRPAPGRPAAARVGRPGGYRSSPVKS